MLTRLCLAFHAMDIPNEIREAEPSPQWVPRQSLGTSEGGTYTNSGIGRPPSTTIGIGRP
jgi:hypothetical protein